jgi:hypothetical protein
MIAKKGMRIKKASLAPGWRPFIGFIEFVGFIGLIGFVGLIEFIVFVASMGFIGFIEFVAPEVQADSPWLIADRKGHAWWGIECIAAGRLEGREAGVRCVFWVIRVR